MANEPTKYIVFGIFGGVWIVLMLLGWFVLYYRDDATFKRRWLPRLMVLGGAVMVAFAATLNSLSPEPMPPVGLAVFAAAVASGFYSTGKAYRFCDKCGATLHNYSWAKPMRFCPHCGTELGGKLSRQADPDFDE